MPPPVATERELAVPASPSMNLTLFQTSDPKELVESARKMAVELASVIDQCNLYLMIGAKKYVELEGWTLLGSMLGVFPVTVWSRRIDDDSACGWEARVEARTQSGAVVGAAEAMCLDSEKNWAGKDDFTLRSMAQTRAAGKAMRLPLSFVMTLAGYAPTPREEMDGVVPTTPPKRGAPRQTPAAPPMTGPNPKFVCEWNDGAIAKGTPLREPNVTLRDLETYGNWLKERLNDRGKEKWRARNEAHVQEVRAEYARRTATQETSDLNPVDRGCVLGSEPGDEPIDAEFEDVPVGNLQQ